MFFGASLLALCTNASLFSYLTQNLPNVDSDEGLFNKPLKQRYDYIIVGAGSAGGILATRLSEDNVSVLLLEAGGSDHENEFTRIPLMWQRTLKSEVDWNFYTVPQTHAFFSNDKKISNVFRGKVLGGTGSINGMNYFRGSRHDYDGWAKEGCKGWSYKDVLPYFKKSEHFQTPEFTNSSYHGYDGPLVITQMASSPLDSLHKMAAIEKGLPVVDCNGANQLGYCSLQANLKDGERCSSASCFLRPALSRPNLQVNTNTHVSKLIIRNKTTDGVTVLKDGKEINVYADKEVILSAGVFNSPQILHLTIGIGPKDHLHEMKIPLVEDLPVGERMQEHMHMFFQYSTNTSLNLNTERQLDIKSALDYIFYKKGIHTYPGNDGHIYAHLPANKNAESPPDLQFTFGSPADEEESIRCAFNKMNNRGDFDGKFRSVSSGFGVLLCKLHHESRGTVRLKSKNPLDAPLIDPQYLSKQTDVDAFISIIRYAQEFANNSAWQSIGAKFIRQEECDGFCLNLTFDTDEYWECMIRHYAQQACHHVGTCRMGAVDDPTAVVDPDLRVKGIKKLRVADSSVMRNVPSANTQAATMMIAEKAADLIKHSR